MERTQVVECMSFDRPSEVREFPHGRAELVEIGGSVVGRLILEPGWRWSSDVKPIAGTELCEAPHMQYQVQGQLHVVMEDGTELQTGPGDVVSLPARHDAWVVGDETVVVVDWFGLTHYAER